MLLRSLKIALCPKPLKPLAIRKFTSTPSPSPSPSPSAKAEDQEPPREGSSSMKWVAGAGVLAGLAGLAGLAYYQNEASKPLDYRQVYNAIAEKLENDDYDDGSYGPVLVRLAWHAAGTFDKDSKTGGSNGATMRFSPESNHGANAGLKVARDFLEPIKKKFPQITYADLWSLGGVCALQEMGGPTIKWRPGRSDLTAESVTPDGRLPDASKAQKHLRDIFYRMGFNDQEIVALSGAHALGRCHTDRSGFQGPWTFSPTVFTNAYFQLLMSEYWDTKKWDGPKQYEDRKTKSLMMLPSDLALLNDRTFYRHVKAYAADEKLFFKDFATAFQKLEELGVPFNEDTPVFEFAKSE